MRIISGKYKSRKIWTPAGSALLRPTTDRARESLFNILTNMIDFKGTTCADLFCGSGSVGLECLSRGAGFCYFIDTNTSAIRKNTEILELSDVTEILKCDAVDFLSKNSELNIDLIFADPPYEYYLYTDLLIKASKLKALFIIEHSVSLEVPAELKKYHVSERKAGIANFSFFDFS